MNERSQVPIVTVCLTTFCSEAFIERTLQSIADQSYGHFQCLISDDGSDDNTVQICQRFAERDTRFVVQSNQARVGWLRNVNRIWAQNLGEFFLNISHDDELGPSLLKALVEALQAHPQASVAYSDVEKVTVSGQSGVAYFELPESTSSMSSRGIHILKGGGDWWLPYHGLVRSATLKVSRKLHSNLAGEYRADQVWVFGLALSGAFVRVPQVLWKKNDREDSVSFTWDTSLFRTTAVMLSIGKVACLSNIPLRHRFAILLGIPYNYLRMIRWKCVCLFQPSKRSELSGPAT